MNHSQIPNIVPIVLRQGHKAVSSGQLPAAEFQRQLERLRREELTPRGFSLNVAERPDGVACFVISSGHGGTVAVVDCEPLDNHIVEVEPGVSRNEFHVSSCEASDLSEGRVMCV